MVKPSLFKIIITGEGGVGKTTLLHRFVEGQFLADTKMTLGVEFFLKEIEIEDKKVLLQIWDFGGQVHFRPLLKNYALGSRGALILFDLTRPSSLDGIDQWVDICTDDNPDIPILFLGTKIDILGLNSIDDDYITDFIDRYKFRHYLKISSKTGENVNLAFELLAKEIMRNLI